MKLTYVCKYCGFRNHITSFWKWFITPHLFSKKWLRCEACGDRYYMKRVKENDNG